MDISTAGMAWALLLRRRQGLMMSWTLPLVLLTCLSAWSLPQNWRTVLHFRCQLVLPVSQHLLQNVLGILKSLLGQVALPLHLDVERLRDVGHDDVDQPADAKDDVLEDYDEGELECEDLPMHRSKRSGVVPEPPVVAFRLSLCYPVLHRRL